MGFCRLLQDLEAEYSHFDADPRAKCLKIASDHNITVLAIALGDDGQSVLVVDDGHWRIIVNVDMPVAHQTWSLAHELAHYFLHRADNMGFYSHEEGRTVQEHEANELAANLLMPSSFIMSLIAEGLGVSQMAQRLGLAADTVRNRLVALQLLTLRRRRRNKGIGKDTGTQ